MIRGLDPYANFQRNIRQKLGGLREPDFRSGVEDDEESFFKRQQEEEERQRELEFVGPRNQEQHWLQRLMDRSPMVKRFIMSQDPGQEPLLPPRTDEPDTWGGGFTKGLYDEFVRPSTSAAGIAGSLAGLEGRSFARPMPKARPNVNTMKSAGSGSTIPGRGRRLGGMVEPDGSIIDVVPHERKLLGMGGRSQTLNDANSMQGAFQGDRTVGKFPEGSGGLSSIGRMKPYEMPTPRAEFAFDWPEAGGTQYNVQNGPYHGSTVGEGRLNELGIPVPPRPAEIPDARAIARVREAEFARKFPPKTDLPAVSNEMPPEFHPTDAPVRLPAVQSPTKDLDKLTDLAEKLKGWGLPAEDVKAALIKSKPKTSAGLTEQDWAKLNENIGPESVEPIKASKTIPGDFGENRVIKAEIAKIEGEIDPEIVLDNYNNTRQELEWSKLHGTADEQELARIMHDSATDRMNQLKGNKSTPGGGYWPKDDDFLGPKSSEAKPPANPDKISVGMGNADDIKEQARIIRINSRAKYSGRVAGSATKELLQNAFDATEDLGPDAKVDVVIHDFDTKDPVTGDITSAKKVVVKDNGPGLDTVGLQTLYTQLYKSGKSGDATKRGKFGVGKGAYLVGGDYVKVTSVVREAAEPGGYEPGTQIRTPGKKGKLMEHSFEGDPDTLMQEVELKHREVPEGTPTGITTEVTIPKDEDMSPANRYLQSLLDHSHSMRGNLTVTRKQHNKKYSWSQPDRTLPVAEKTDTHNIAQLTPQKHIAKVQHDANTTFDISYGKDSSMGETNMIRANYLNNGLYQGSGYVTIRKADGAAVNAEVPSEITVDVRSNAPEDARNYPWEENRETVRIDHQMSIGKAVYEHVGKPISDKAKRGLEQSYNEMPRITLPNGEEFFAHDGGTKFQPSELMDFLNEAHNKEIAGFINRTVKDYLEIIKDKSLGDLDWTTKVNRVGFILTDDGEVSPGLGKFHKGIWIPHPAQDAGHVTIAINPFGLMARMDADAASAGVEHTIIHEIAHNLATPGEDAHGLTHNYLMSKLVEYIGDDVHGEITAQFRKIITGAPNGTGYVREIQKILRQYLSVQRRNPTKEDPLGRTGISSETRPGGREGGIPGDVKSGGDRTVEPIESAGSGLPEVKPIEVTRLPPGSAEGAENVWPQKASGKWGLNRPQEGNRPFSENLSPKTDKILQEQVDRAKLPKKPKYIPTGKKKPIL